MTSNSKAAAPKSTFERLRPLIAIGVLVMIFGGATRLLFGDGCGCVERGIRAGLGTWDMWQVQTVVPYEEPLYPRPEGTVETAEPVHGASISASEVEATRQGIDPFADAVDKVAALSQQQLEEQSALAYRRFCRHCHGDNGDNRIIVGESFGFRLPDLRSEDYAEFEDRDLFDIITHGSGRMLALGATLTPEARVLAIVYMRTLQGRPSVPFFKPRWVEPAQRPPPAVGTR